MPVLEGTIFLLPFHCNLLIQPISSCTPTCDDITSVSLQVVLRHFLLRREEVLSQCRVWERTLAEGIEKMQARGVATAHLKDFLRRLVKCVETLKVEIGKIEKKLSQSVSDKSETNETSCPPEVTSTREEMEGDPESNETTAPSDSGPDRDGEVTSSPDGDGEVTPTLAVSSTEEDAVVRKTMATEQEAKVSSESHVTPPQPPSESHMTPPQPPSESHLTPPSQPPSEGHVTPPQPPSESHVTPPQPPSESHVTPPQPPSESHVTPPQPPSESHVTPPPQPGPSTPAIVAEEGGEVTKEGESTVEPAAPSQHSCMSTDSQSGPQDHEQ